MLQLSYIKILFAEVEDSVDFFLLLKGELPGKRRSKKRNGVIGFTLLSNKQVTSWTVKMIWKNNRTKSRFLLT